jgi:hypothetical protein
MKLETKYQISAINSCWEKCDEKWAYMFNVYKNQQSRRTPYHGKHFWTIRFLLPVCRFCWFLYTFNIPVHLYTGSRNLMGPKTLPMIWGTYMTLVTKYQISVINSCWEKRDEKCAYMFNVYKNQLSRQTGSRWNLRTNNDGYYICI